MANTSKHRPRSIVRLLLLGISATVCLVALVFMWLLLSPSVPKWLVNKANSELGLSLSVNETKGALIGPLYLYDVKIDQFGYVVDANEVMLDWQVYDLLKLTLNFEKIQANNLHISKRQVDGEVPASTQMSLPEIRMPIGIRIGDLSCEQCSYLAGGQDALLFKQLQLKASYVDTELHVESLHVETQDHLGELTGRLRTQARYPLNVDVQWKARIADNKSINALLALSGDIDALYAQLDVNAPIQANVKARLNNVLGDMAWTAALDIESFSLNTIKRQWPDIELATNLSLSGDAKHYQIEGEVLTDIESKLELKHALLLSGESAQINIKSLKTVEVKSGASSELSGSVDLATERIDARIRWQDVVYPLAEPVLVTSKQGELSIRGSLEQYAFSLNAYLATQDIDELNVNAMGVGSTDRVDVDQFNLTVFEGEVSGAASMMLADLSVVANIEWANLTWLNDAGRYVMSSGEADVVYRDKQYQLTSSTHLRGDLVPESAWELVGHGDFTGLDKLTIKTRLLNGELDADVSASWQDELSWRAEALFKNINPADSWPQWQGLLSGAIVLRGDHAALNRRVVIEQFNLAGQLMDQPIQSNAYVSLINDDVDVAYLELQSGQAFLQVAGRWADHINLAWNVNVPALAKHIPDATGSLKANGVLHGERLSPTLQMQINANALRWREYRVGHVDGTADLDLVNFSQLDLSLNANDIFVHQVPFNALTINARGKAQQHSLLATLSSEKTSLDLSLTGRYSDELWQGSLARFQFDDDYWGEWSLSKPAFLQKKNEQLVINPLCLTAPRLSSDLCVHAHIQDQAWGASVNAHNFPLDKLNRYVEEDVAFAGRADVDATVQQAYSGDLSGSVTAASVQTDVQFKQFSNDVLVWRDVYLDAQLGMSALSVSLRSTMGENDHVALTALLPGFDPKNINLNQQAMDGALRMTIQDMAWLSSYIPEVKNIQGKMDVDVVAQGVLSKPRISAKANVQNGSLDIPRAGIKLSDVALQVSSHDENKVHYVLEATSGEGRAHLSGHTLMSAAQGWPSQIQMSGDNVEVLKIPEAHVFVSPALTLTTKNKQLHLTGDVVIPRAKLQPKDTSAAVTVSDDMVIVGEAFESVPESKWQISSDVRVLLGPRVRFYGYGFEGDINGDLILSDEPGRLTTARGELLISNGRYRAYGQRLNIENGKLVFSGGPVANPGLDIKAVRMVDEVVSGVWVSGTLLSPRMALFSQPAMGQANALSYLVLGKPMDGAATQEDGAILFNAAIALGLSGGDMLARKIGDRFGFDEMRVETGEQGEATFIVGRYLTPRLYISYGVGLLDSLDSVNLRYQLARRWRVTAEKRGDEQGGDLIFTIKR